ncbi:MAG: LysM peptidoglycan-binding domain-containing protein, partial [Muribaculaceae bacterium]|nr:LysM peptidoglycan-binding domain-containing protein [Muribaculaceae bacterium]
VTDTLHINKRVHFNQISKVLDIPVEELRMLNPQFRADLIPGNSSKSYNLILPSQQIHAYIMSEEDILTYESEKYARRIDAEPGGKASGEVEVTDTFIASEIGEEEPDAYREMAEAPTMKAVAEANPAQPAAQTESISRTLGPASSKSKTHKVEPGESIASIAAKYGVAPEQLKEWNNLRRNSVRTGQVLKISGELAQSSSSDATSRRSENASRKAEESKNVKNDSKKTQKQGAESSYKKKAAQADEQASQSSRKKNKANTPQAVSTAKKGAQADAASGKKKGKKAAAASAAQPKEHTVQSGESYERIAKKYGLTADELKKANNATSDMIKPDQKLKIPKKAGEKAAASSSKKKSSGAAASSNSKKKGSASSSKKKGKKK